MNTKAAPENRDMYFSVDIETDGDAPGTSSMLSIGIVALDPVTLEPCGEFYKTLKRLPEAQPKNGTMEWWDQWPEQWAAARKSPEDPKDAMKALHDFVVEQGKQAKRRHNLEKGPIPVFVAYPAGFDFSFVYYYLHRFVGECVFSFSALDMKSFAMGALGISFTGTKQAAYPQGWVAIENRLPHHALEDARHQAHIFVNSLRWRQKRDLYEPGIESADRIVPPGTCATCLNGKNLGELSETCTSCGRRGTDGL